MRPYEGTESYPTLYRFHHIESAPFSDHARQVGKRDYVVCIGFFRRKPASSLFDPESGGLGACDTLSKTLSLVRILAAGRRYEVIPKKVNQALGRSDVGRTKPPGAPPKSMAGA